MLKLLGIALIVHGLAHAGAGMWASGSQLVITPLWWFAMVGYIAAGLGALGLEPFRRRVDRLVFFSALASIMLMYFFSHALMLPGIVINLGFAAAVTRDRIALKLDAQWDKPSRHPIASALGVAFLIYATAVIAARPWAIRMDTSSAEPSAHLFVDTLYRNVRYRDPGRPSLRGTIAGPVELLVLEPAHFIMQRGMLRGLRNRADGRMTEPAGSE